MMPDAGTSPDYIKAYDLNRRAFEKDHAEGAANIGLLYENGWGANQDFELAASWYQKAIASKSSQSPQAQLGLARLHRLKLIKNASMATAKRLCKEALSIDYTGLGYPESPTSADHREINLCLNQVGFINR